jgi:hypothetical protein
MGVTLIYPGELLLPDCAVCGRPVEEIACYDDALTLSRFVEVHCHGETERVELTVDDLRKISRGELSVRPGAAFARPRLDEVAPAPRLEA